SLTCVTHKTARTQISTLSLHDALPIYLASLPIAFDPSTSGWKTSTGLEGAWTSDAGWTSRCTLKGGLLCRPWPPTAMWPSRRPRPELAEYLAVALIEPVPGGARLPRADFTFFICPLLPFTR